ncbi:hypothetical protein Acr_00g0080900 [Actinidia rufa]|uniref:Uncharacterized protein n=1 Tax=Actinidia rufa TaxID=165716 RepID=A0A7J0DU64_9ERIC|nr:hypothetical protein Acr_00g0080900 [Actinidia rufa]
MNASFSQNGGRKRNGVPEATEAEEDEPVVLLPQPQSRHIRLRLHGLVPFCRKIESDHVAIVVVPIQGRRFPGDKGQVPPQQLHPQDRRPSRPPPPLRRLQLRPAQLRPQLRRGRSGGSEDGHIEEFSSRLPVSPPRRRLRDLELSPAIQTVEMSSPAAGMRIGGSSTAATGGKTAVERPRPVTREISVEQC